MLVCIYDCSNVCDLVYSDLFIFISIFFFFQAEDGIRDADVTGVQTCALPILTVHGTFLPSALKTDVVPIFFPNNPGISLNF